MKIFFDFITVNSNGFHFTVYSAHGTVYGHYIQTPRGGWLTCNEHGWWTPCSWHVTRWLHQRIGEVPRVSIMPNQETRLHVWVQDGEVRVSVPHKLLEKVEIRGLTDLAIRWYFMRLSSQLKMSYLWSWSEVILSCELKDWEPNPWQSESDSILETIDNDWEKEYCE